MRFELTNNGFANHRLGPLGYAAEKNATEFTETTELCFSFLCELRVFCGLQKNGPGWNRTNVGLRQRVYSPSPLAARAPTHLNLKFILKI